MRDSKPVVVDASAAVALLTRTSLGFRIAAELRGRTVRVPELFDAEVLSALKGIERSGRVAPADIASAVSDLALLPFERRGLGPFAAGAWAMRHQLSLYDAFYVALARAADCPVLTTDGRWQRAGDLGVTMVTIR